MKAAKNCTELTKLQLNVDHFNDKLWVNQDGQKVWIILSKVPVRKPTTSSRLSTRWKESYVSGSSFDENKREDSCPQFVESNISSVLRLSLRQPYLKSPSLCTRIISPYNIQVHGFKTKHNLNAELNRNPNLASRIKQWLIRVNPNFFNSVWLTLSSHLSI